MNVPTPVLENHEPTETPLDPTALWSTPLSKAHVSPPKPRAASSAGDKTVNSADNVPIDVSNGDANQGDVNIVFNGASPGTMDQDPDLHPRWVGVKVLYVDSADAQPILGKVAASQKKNQQASFQLLLDDGTKVWLDAKITAGAALTRQEYDQHQRILGFAFPTIRH